MTVRWTVRADGDQGAQFAPRPSPIRVAIQFNTCGFSSFGRAPPCQGGGGGFEPRNPLQNKNRTQVVRFFVLEGTRARRGAVVNDSPVDCQSRGRPSA